MNEPPSNSGAFIAKLGAWLQLAQVIGFAGTVSGMMKACRAIENTYTVGTSDPTRLSGAIGEVLMAAAGGIAVSLVGVILVIIAVTVCHYRAVWMFWFLCLYGGLMTPTYFFPFGLFFLIYGLVKKDEFLRPQSPALPV